MGANQSLGCGSVTLTARSGGHLTWSTASPSWFGIWQTDQLAPPITHFPIACRLDSGVRGGSGVGVACWPACGVGPGLVLETASFQSPPNHTRPTVLVDQVAIGGSRPCSPTSQSPQMLMVARLES